MIRSAKFEIALIAIIGFMAYGLQIPFLGFFQDDWNFVYYFSKAGWQGLLELMTVDGRPGGVWIYALGFSIFGYNTVLWQLFSILFRIFTGIIAFLILEKLLPDRKNGNLIASIFFVIYPFFTLQPLSVSFAQHYVGYFLIGVSFLFTILAFENPKRRLLFTAVAVILSIIQLFNVEYFVGLELLRPLLILHILSRGQEMKWIRRIARTAFLWFPYFLALVSFVYWRSFFLAGLGIRNNPLNAFTDSGEILQTNLQYFLADLTLMLASSWSVLINPEFFVLGPVRNLYLILAILISGGVFYLLAGKVFERNDLESSTLKVMLIGGIIIVAGMIPAYSIGYIMNNKLPPWNSRFSLPALLGLALIVSELIIIVISSPRTRSVFLSILIGLTVGYHNSNMFNFKSAWEKQERFYQQLLWRAPSLAPGTALISNEEFLGYMGDYPTSMAIHTMYESKPTGADYWLFTMSNPKTAAAIANDAPLTESKITLNFSGDETRAIYFTFEPENKQCLWVLRPEDADFKQLPASLKAALIQANLGSIQQSSEHHSIFGQIVSGDRSTWCYFYQKADLARQHGLWDVVVELWQEAESAGFRPENGFEYVPFIEGFAYTGDWEFAFQLTKISNKTTKAMYFILCPTWERLIENTPQSSQRDMSAEKAFAVLGCKN